MMGQLTSVRQQFGHSNHGSCGCARRPLGSVRKASAVDDDDQRGNTLEAGMRQEQMS